jgi:fumarylacetoacetase
MEDTDPTTNPSLKSWIPVPEGSDFPIQNLPYGIISGDDMSPRAATIIGETVIDLYSLLSMGYLYESGIPPDVFNQESLNSFIASGKPAWRKMREGLSRLFSENNPELRDNPEDCKDVLIPVSEARLLMPVRVGDYTDFYSSMEHATNLGTMFRDPANALLPNWKHLPVGYHGRSSSLVVSGTPIHRPKGQTKKESATLPDFGPTSQLDFELELAFVAGKKTELGTSIPVAEAEDHIFGMLLFNDLSARDIQRWEYVPLGPFLSKNFGSVISPWIITMDALEPFRVAGPAQEPAVLPYLQSEGNRNFDIQLDVFIQAENQQPFRVCHSNYRYLYWNMAQQLAHQTVNGCNINVGDLYASGTISGPDPGSYGSMLEIAWNGTKPVSLPDGSTRSFIHDNDTVVLHGYCEKDGLRIGFGEAVTKILPAV